MLSKKDDPENRVYWRLARETRDKIREWPIWKQAIRLTEHSKGFVKKEYGSNI